MSDFTQRTRSYTDARLFRIVREAKKYAPEAVAAAEAEIGERGLNSADFPIAPASRPFGRLRELATDLAPTRSIPRPDDVIDWTDEPVLDHSKSNRYLQLLLIVISLCLLLELYNQLDYLRFAFGALSPGFDPVIITIAAGVLFQVFILFMLWQRKRIGFQLTAGYATFSMVTFIGLILFVQQAAAMSTFETLNFCIINKKLSILTNIGLPIVMIWLMCQPALRLIFGVSREYAIRILAIGVGLGLLIQLYYHLSN